jgi:signal transduction histidine kinase
MRPVFVLVSAVAALLAAAALAGLRPHPLTNALVVLSIGAVSFAVWRLWSASKLWRTDAILRALKTEELAIRLEAEEQERRRWARELHDDTLQALAAMRLVLSAALRDPHPEAPQRAAEQVTQLLADEADALRRLVNDLRPIVLDELGLEAALLTLAERANDSTVARVELDVAPGAGHAVGSGRLPAAIEQTAYRVAQEAVGNALRHGDPTLVTVHVCRTRDGWLHGLVVDDGVGFQVDRPSVRHGLANMRDRCRITGGRLTIDSAPGRGTCVDFRLPLCPS